MKRARIEHDMEPKLLDGCWECGKKVKYGIVASIVDNPSVGPGDMSDDYFPICWRFFHEACYKPKSTELHAVMPLTFVSWIDMTLRLLDHKGHYFLFEHTNWRYVLDAVSQNYVQGLNEFVNPEPKRAAVAKPKRVLKRRK